MALPTRGSEFQPLADLQSRMNRLFEDFWGGFGTPGVRPMAGVALAPQVEVSEDDNAVTVSVELPGVEEKDIDLSFENGILRVRAEKKAESEKKERRFVLRERSFGAFERAFSIGPDIEEDKIEADFRNGVLTVTLPKSKKAKEHFRRIPVKAG